MGKFIAICTTIVIGIIVAGIYPHVAVGLTAIGIVLLFLLFGKEY